MTDENRLIMDKARGKNAQQIIENELFIEAFDATEKGLFKVIKNSRTKDTEDRQNAYLTIKLLEKLRQHLVVVMNGGKASAAQLVRIEETRFNKLKRKLNV